MEKQFETSVNYTTAKVFKDVVLREIENFDFLLDTSKSQDGRVNLTEVHSMFEIMSDIHKESSLRRYATVAEISNQLRLILGLILEGELHATDTIYKIIQYVIVELKIILIDNNELMKSNTDISEIKRVINLAINL